MIISTFRDTFLAFTDGVSKFLISLKSPLVVMSAEGLNVPQVEGNHCVLSLFDMQTYIKALLRFRGFKASAPKEGVFFPADDLPEYDPDMATFSTAVERALPAVLCDAMKYANLAVSIQKINRTTILSFLVIDVPPDMFLFWGEPQNMNGRLVKVEHCDISTFWPNLTLRERDFLENCKFSVYRNANRRAFGQNHAAG